MSEIAKLELNGQIFEFPVIEGTENEKAIDISSLRTKTGYITIDPGFKNTGSCESAITGMLNSLAMALRPLVISEISCTRLSDDFLEDP